jgi:G3E family GTPase
MLLPSAVLSSSTDKSFKLDFQPYLSLTRNLDAAIIVISGLWGSGKTELGRRLAHGIQLSNDQKALILNELDQRKRNQDADRFPEGISKSMVGECADCGGAPKTIRLIKEQVNSGKKLIIAEVSGRSKGSNVASAVRQEMLKLKDKNVIVRHITLVDIWNLSDGSSSEQAPEQLLSNIRGADRIYLTHIDDTANPQEINKRIGSARKLVQHARFEQDTNNTLGLLRYDDLISAPDFESLISPLSLKSVVCDLVTPKIFSGQIGTQVFPHMHSDDRHDHSHHHHEHHRHELEQIITEELILDPSLQIEQLISVLANRDKIKLSRARGTLLNRDGTYSAIDIRRRDDGRLAFETRAGAEQIPQIGAQSNLLLISGEKLLPISELAKIGGPDVRQEIITSAISTYRSKEMIISQLEAEGTLYLQDDADGLLARLEQYAPYHNNMPEHYRANFISAWEQMLTQYIQWRCDLIPLLNGIVASGEYDDQISNIGEALTDLGLGVLRRLHCHVLDPNSPSTGLISEERAHDFAGLAMEIRPWEIVYMGLGRATYLQLDGRKELEAGDLSALKAATIYAKSIGISADLAQQAANNLNLLKIDSSTHESWKREIPDLTKQILGSATR